MKGDWGAAGADALGVAADVAAVVVPGLPAAGTLAVQTTKTAANLAADLAAATVKYADDLPRLGSSYYRDPITNQLVPISQGKKITKDHIVPQEWIRSQDEFSLLTPANQKKVLDYPDNLQPLPFSENCSKGCKLETGPKG